MSDLTEFLLARYAEEEAAWTELAGVRLFADYARLARNMLREVTAKRRIVEDMSTGLALWDRMKANERTTRRGDLHRQEGVMLAADVVLRHLASVYSDHPDYRPEWRP